MNLKLFFILAFLFIFTNIFSENIQQKKVLISFKYEKQFKLASNQFAIWIENENGELIKNIFVTRFTAVDGYSKRKEALSTWVERSNVKNYSKEKIDSISGATPKSSFLTYLWDCTDQNENPVSDGTYRFFVEGSTHWKDKILFSATVTLGEHSYIVGPFIEDFTREALNSKMITDLSAEVK